MKKLLPVIILLIIIHLTTIAPAPLKKINKLQIGERVRISGLVEECFKPERLTILNLSDETGSIKVIFFKEVSAWKGMKAEITGRIDEYEGERELKGVKIKLID
jgi:RecG-like helicase